MLLGEKEMLKMMVYWRWVVLPHKKGVSSVTPSDATPNPSIIYIEIRKSLNQPLFDWWQWKWWYYYLWWCRGEWLYRISWNICIESRIIVAIDSDWFKKICDTSWCIAMISFCPNILLLKLINSLFKFTKSSGFNRAKKFLLLF